jgi:menaquinone-dependent protoporphyrinogen IX oxidase
MSRVLVVYATKHGSTREVADAVAAVALDGGAFVQAWASKAIALTER